MKRSFAFVLGAWVVGTLGACSDDDDQTLMSDVESTLAPDAGASSSESTRARDSGASSHDVDASTVTSSELREADAGDGAASTSGDSTSGDGGHAHSNDDASNPTSVGCQDGDRADASYADASCAGDGTAQLQRALDELVSADLVELGALGIGVTVEFADGRRLESAAGAIGPDQSSPSYDVATTKQVIGSVTKLFTAVLVMQLVEAGALHLEQTIDQWFDFPDAKDITIRMLLQHTSGLADCLAQMTEAQFAETWKPSELVALAVAAERVGEPGGAALYSNTNFAVLAMVVEEVSGKSWQANLAERITEPLELDETFYAGDPAGADHLVDGWLQTEEGWVGTLQFTDPSVGWGFGALTATNRELARFGKALFNAELFADAATLDAMLAFDVEMDPSVLSPGEPPQTVGLGVLRYQLDEFVLDGHLGHILGYNSAILHDPETGVTLTGTTNTEGAVVAITLVKIAQALRDM